MASTMARDRLDTAEAEDGVRDGLSGLPDDVLLDMLDRLVNAGDAHTAARTSILSRRWRHLPRYEVPHVSLDVTNFYPVAEAGSRRRRKDWYLPYQYHASEGFVQALWYFLEAPPSARVIETLRLKMLLTKYELVRRVGRLVGEAARCGRVKAGASVELEILTERGSLSGARDAPVMLGYGSRFTQFIRGCPRAFRALTRLTVENLWFEYPAVVTDLIRHCRALEHLSMRSFGFAAVTSAAMVVDAPPESRLRTLLCLECHVPGVELVQAPSLVEFHCGWRLDDGMPPASFGWTPSLRRVTLDYRQMDDREPGRWKLTDFLLMEHGQLEVLTLSFQATTIWVQPEYPTYLKDVLGGLKELRLEKIHPAGDLSWALFLLGAAPLLETLHTEIFNHAYHHEWQEEEFDMEPDSWYLPPPGFTRRRLKEVTIRRAFHVAKDVTFVRVIMDAAVNLEKLTLGVEDLGCWECAAAQASRPALARSRFRSTGASCRDVDVLVEKLKDCIPTSAQIVVL